MATLRDLAQGSLRLIEEVGAGDTASAESCADFLTAFNAMLSSWSIQGDLVYTKAIETFTLTPNDGIYTLGPTGDFVTTRPTRILSVTINDGTNDIPLEMYSIEQYASIDNKTIQSLPCAIYIDYNYPNLGFRLLNVPSQNYSITFYSEKPLSEYSTINDTLVAPPGYERAFRYNGAVEIAPEYGKSASPDVRRIAIESKSAIRNQNNRTDNDKIMTDDALQTSAGYNIYTGRY